VKNVVTMVGSSIFENYKKSKDDEIYNDLKDKSFLDIEDYEEDCRDLKASVIKWAKDKPNASAEIKSLLKIKIEDELIKLPQLPISLDFDLIEDNFFAFEVIHPKTLKEDLPTKEEFLLCLYRLLKKSFFSQTRPWANKSKILSAGLPEANRIVFEK